MRRCPECHQLYDGSEKFCDEDGAPLVEVAPPRHASPTKPPPSNDAWVFATFGVMGGIVLSLLIGAFVLVGLRDEDGQTPEAEEQPAAQRPAPARPAQFASALPPEATPTPAESPTPEEEAEEEVPAAPAPTAEAAPQPVAASINRGPVSTGVGGAGTGEALIRLKDGTQVEADAAWEDGQGIWYRRGALVTFVERSRVEAITAAPKPEASPAPAEP